jgi:hypothetical protein
LLGIKGKKKKKIRRDFYALLKPKAAQASPWIVNLLTHCDHVLFISKIEKNKDLVKNVMFGIKF